MDRLASGEVVVELETQAKIDAEQTLAQGNEFNPQNPGNTPTNRSPHASSRSIHASSHSLAAPVGANGLLSYHSEELHTVAVGADDTKKGTGSVELMEDVPPHKQILAEYNMVSAWVPAKFSAPTLLPKMPAWFSKRKQKTDAEPNGAADKPQFRQVLFSISGCCRPGELLAFMGPSGSGKTTLLSIIGGRAQSMMRREGDLLFNGKPAEKKLKRSIGYVMQDDLLYEALTVYEVLWYAAQLRLPRHMTKAQKRERVSTVITALGLDTCKDTIVGGFFRKGISGGERKRTSVGHELLINPSLLLLDEPTSGLDSTTAMHLLTSLRQLATGGRAVITTIHQPSSRLYQQLDKLLLLSKGHAMYYGRAAETVEWFAKLGYTLPYRVNTADFILDLSSADVSTEKRDGEASRLYLIDCFETYASRHTVDGFEAKGVDEELAIIRGSIDTGSQTLDDLDRRRSQKAHNGSLRSIADGDTKPMANGHHAVAINGSGQDGEDDYQNTPDVDDERWTTSYWTQYTVLLSRAARVKRFQAFATKDIAQFMVIAVLAGLFWLRKGGNSTVAGAQQVTGLLFFELLFLSLRALFTALFTFPSDFKMLLKERASGMYKLSAFYFARTSSDMPLDLVIPTIFILIVYFMSGLRTDGAKYFFENYFSVILVMLVCQSFGLLLGTLVMDAKVAQTIASTVMLTFILVAGYFVQNIYVWIAWLKYISFIYYGYGLLLHVEYNGRIIYSCTSSASGTCVQVEVSNPETNPICHPTPIQAALRLKQNPNSMGWVALNACILILILVAMRILVYIALRYKTSRK